MKTATTLLASCALLVSFPASTQQLPAAKPAPAPKAEAPQKIDVTVIVPAGCGSGIHVAPDPIVTKPGAVITWTIRSSGTWKFAGDGITFYKPGAAFGRPTKGNADTTVEIQRVAREEGVFKYDITLARETPDKKTENCKHDPTVINQ